MYLRRLPLFLAAFLFAATASAQSTEPDSSDEETILSDSILTSPVLVRELHPVEVRAIRAGQDAPFAKTDISGAELQKANLGQDLPFLLQYLPSVVVSSDAGAGVGYTGIRIRGSDGTRINTTLNGIAINDAESSGSYFVDLPDLASSTSSIQVQRGVGSSTNGPGAFGGTISLANLDFSEQSAGSAALTYGSFNTQKYTLQAGTGMLPGQIALNVRLSRITSDGFVDRASSRLSALQLQGMWKPSKKTSIKAMLLMGDEQTYQAWNGVPEEKLRGSDSGLAAHFANNMGVLYFNSSDSQNLFSSDRRRYNYFTYNNQTDNYRQNYYQLFGDHDFSPAVSGHIGMFLTRGIGYYEEYKPQQDLSGYGLPPFVTPGGDSLTSTDLIRRLWLDNYNYGVVYSLLWNAGTRSRITVGGGWSQYIGNHYGNIIWAQFGVPDNHRWYKLDAQKNDFNIYGKAEQKWGQHVFTYGDVQIRSIGYFMNGFRKNPGLKPSVSYTFFNPKAGLTWLIRSTSAQRQKVFTSVAVASKEPNRDDFEAGINSLPKPERLIDIETGYELSSAKFSLMANVFYMGYEDQLVLTGKVNDVGAYTRTNVARSFRSGLELQGTCKPLDWLNLNANMVWSRNEIENYIEYVDNYDDGTQAAISHGNPDIAFSPGIIAGGGIGIQPFNHSAKGRAFYVDVLGKYVGSQFLDNTADKRRSIDAYGLCDLRFRYNIVVRPFREFGINFMLNNVFDKKYENNGYTYSYIYGGAMATQNFYYPQAGFNCLLGLTMKW